MRLSVRLLGTIVLVLASASLSAAEMAIAPGQDELLAALVARGASLPGDCKLTAGEVPGNLIRATYDCPSGRVVLSLSHPGAASSSALRTQSFAIAVEEGAPPTGFVDAIAANVRANEHNFRWVDLTPPSPAPAEATGAAGAPEAPLASEKEASSSSRVTSYALQAGSAVAAMLLATLALTARLARRGGAESAERLALLGITAASFVARLCFSLLNHQSNDDHRVVVDLIRQHAWLAPDPSACMLCSHPKLFHYAWAAALDVVPSGPFNLELGNLLNFLAGTLFLLLALRYLQQRVLTPRIRVLAYAFLSFNAGLVGIFSQATNDGFCALFSGAAIFGVERFLSTRRLAWSLAAGLATVLAALSKASGWAIFAAAMVALVAATATTVRRDRRPLALGALLFMAVFALTVPFCHPYRDNLRRAHTPFVNDAFDAPLLRYEVPRTPVLWVFESFATFRFIELMRVPFDEFSRGPFPAHYDSLWSQLHGRMFFLRFDQAIWPNKDPIVLALGRICLTLGLLPLAALLLGTAARARRMWRAVRSTGPSPLARDGGWVDLLFVAVMVAALGAVVVRYHRLALLFTWMKAIYLFPALLAFFSLFAEGLGQLASRYPRTVNTWMVAMITASIIDLGWLLYDLS